MNAKDLYLRYRRWASRFGPASIMTLGISAAMGALVVLSLAGPSGRQFLFLHVLPWLALIGGPIAAFDAWGAARYRGRPGEGWARAAVIVLVCWGIGGYLWSR